MQLPLEPWKGFILHILHAINRRVALTHQFSQRSPSSLPSPLLLSFQTFFCDWPDVVSQRKVRLRRRRRRIKKVLRGTQYSSSFYKPLFSHWIISWLQQTSAFSTLSSHSSLFCFLDHQLVSSLWLPCQRRSDLSPTAEQNSYSSTSYNELLGEPPWSPPLLIISFVLFSFCREPFSFSKHVSLP